MINSYEKIGGDDDNFFLNVYNLQTMTCITPITAGTKQMIPNIAE